MNLLVVLCCSKNNKLLVTRLGKLAFALVVNVNILRLFVNLWYWIYYKLTGF